MTIEMRPASLYHADLWIGKVVDRAQQEVFRWSEVGVEDGNEFAFCRLQASCESARFITVTISAVVIANGMPESGVALDQSASHVDSLVGGVVQNLDIKFVARIVYLADRIQQSLNDILLVEDRQLDGDARQFLEMRNRFCGAILLVLVVKVNQNVAMRSVAGKQNQDDEIWHQESDVECVRMIEAPESRIQKMLTDIGPNPSGPG